MKINLTIISGGTGVPLQMLTLINVLDFISTRWFVFILMKITACILKEVTCRLICCWYKYPALFFFLDHCKYLEIWQFL